MKADDIRGMLQRWIQDHGTQVEVAQRLGKTPASLSRWLSGKHPLGLQRLDEILAATRIDLLTLVSTYSEGKGLWQVVPLVPLRRLPPMKTDFPALVIESAELFVERISLPIKESPALAVRLPRDVLTYKEGEVVAVVAAEESSLAPGAAVVVQLQGTTEVGVWLQRQGKGAVAVDGIIHDAGSFLLVGRIRGAWRDS